MRALLIEMKCPRHGLERFSIKVIKKFNMPKRNIKPLFRNHPSYGLSSVLVGREVTEEVIEKYIRQYLERRGYMEFILTIKPIYR